MTAKKGLTRRVDTARGHNDRTILWTDAGPLVGTELALGEVS